MSSLSMRGRALCTKLCIDFEQGTCDADFEGKRARHFRWDPSKIFEPWEYSDDSGGGEVEARYEPTPRLMLASVLAAWFDLDRDYAKACVDEHAVRETGGPCRCGASEFIRQRKGPHLGIYCYVCGKWQRWEAAPLSLESARAFVMPFGKHKGLPLERLPDDYLDWLYENCDKGKIPEMARLVFEGRQ